LAQVTASEVLPEGLQIGIKDGSIVCIGKNLPTSSSTEVIDCEGAYVTPGGIDSHVHLAQKNSPTGDGWETGSRSAVAGGTTTILAFASQEREDNSLYPVLEEYHQLSRDQSYCDYGFHFILTNPTEQILKDELPKLAWEEGVTSVKLYMTYEAKKLGDRQILDILFACKDLGMTTMIHAESHDMISLIIEGLERNKHTEPYFHAVARPRIAEDEASYRAISLAELADAPMLIVHMSSKTAIKHVRDAQTRLRDLPALPLPALGRNQSETPRPLLRRKTRLQPPSPPPPPRPRSPLAFNRQRHFHNLVLRPRAEQIRPPARQTAGPHRWRTAIFEDPQRLAGS
jgi:dihydropyrimidinase